MMIDHTELCQHLNLLRTQCSFVYREDLRHDRMTCESPQVVPRESGVYWIGGETITKSGVKIDSVFRVDTDSGGTLLSIYWWIDGKWYEHGDQDAEQSLKLSKEELFPFDWRFSVPLEEDIFHPAAHSKMQTRP